MITIRAARITDAAYIAEGIYEAFLLPSSDLEKDPTFHQRWLDTLIGVCARELHLPFATLAVEPMNSAKILYQELGFRYHRSITIFNEEYHLYVADAYEK